MTGVKMLVETSRYTAYENNPVKIFDYLKP